MSIRLYHTATADPRSVILWPAGQPLPDGYTTLEPPSPDADHIVEWDGEAWVQVPVPPPPEPEPEPGVPMVVSMRQARLAMHHAGILDDVETAVAAAGREAQIEWEYAVEVRRDHPLIASIASELELDESEVDDLFVAAAAIA